MNEYIQNIYETMSVIGRNGQIHKLHSHIDRKEGEFLFSIISEDSSIRNTLEVGCAYGLSSLHICSALQDRSGVSHTIIDPFQNTQWDGVGIRNLETAGIDFFTLIETKSELALPRLLETKEGQFDFIFIDGWHTFDHTLLDCFYATRLLRVGGVLAIDDAHFKSVSRVVKFLKNYPCYKEAGSVEGNLNNHPYYQEADLIDDNLRETMVALKKVEEDNRNWYWHNDAF